MSIHTHFQNQIKYKEGKTYTLPLPPNVLIHPQPLQNQHPNPLLHGHLGSLRLQLFRSNSPQQSPSTRQPEQHEIELAAREELHGDVEEAGIARAQGESGVGEAVTGDVGEGGGEDC